MRVSRKVWIIVGIGIFIIAVVMLSRLYSGQVNELNELTDRLAIAQTRLPGLISDKQELEAELAQAQSSVASNADKYPPSVHSIEYGEYLFEIAGRCNVTLASLSFPSPGSRQEGPVTYWVVSLSLPVSGTRDNIFEFIQVLRTDPKFASTRVKSVSLSGDSASISVDIYGYQR
jgi:hypothetical protein